MRKRKIVSSKLGPSVTGCGRCRKKNSEKLNFLTSVKNKKQKKKKKTVKENIYFAQGDREPLTLLFPPSLRNSIICNLYVGAVLFSAFDNDQARLLLEGKK